MENRQNQFKRWDQYVEEAHQDPFLIPVSDEETIEIAPPTGAAILHASRAIRTGDAEALLWAICGDQWPRVQELIGTANYRAMQELSTDMVVYFDLTEDLVLIGPSGGRVIENDPRRINALLRQGYTLQGEAGTSRT